MIESADLRLGGTLDAVPEARRFVVDRLAELGQEQYADDAEIAVTELVTNALLHAAPPLSLRVAPVDDRVRIEVRDGSRTVPVRGRADAGAMTGRGLALVEALALRWGVEAAQDGKVVWAEFGPRESEVLAATDLDGDVEALLAAWADDEPMEERFTVRLGDVPTDLLLEAKAQVDGVVREFTLAASGAASGSSSDIPEQLAELIERVVHGFSDARLSIKRQALAAAARGDKRTNLTLSLPATAADAAEDYLAGLDEADSYARAARLLTLETPFPHKTFRRWYISSLVAQLRAAARGEPTPAADPFENRLVQELDANATARQNLERVAGLQAVTAALSAASTTEEVATVVVREAVQALGALGGGLLLPDANGRLQVPVSVGYGDPLLHRLRTEPQEAELPAAEAMRTGQAVWLESPQERDVRYPGLIGMEPGTAALCAVPLSVGGRTLGALRFSFGEPRLFDEYERNFVLAMGAQTAQAFDRAAVYEAERSARAHAEALAARLTRLQTVAAELSRANSVEDVADVVVNHAASAVGSGLATVSLLVDHDMLEVIRMVGVRPETESRWARYSVSEELPGSVAVRTGEPVLVADRAELERRYPRLAGEVEQDSSLICIPMRAGGRAIGVISLSFPTDRDITSPTEIAFFTNLADSCGQAIERTRALAAVHGAAAKLAFLAEATGELSESLDYRTTLGKVAALIVPRLADWCAVQLLELGEYETVAVAHVDPAKVALAEELQKRYPVDPNATSGVPEVIRSGVGELYPTIDDEMLVAGTQDAEHLGAMRALGLRSVIIVPLTGLSGTLGALTMIQAESGRQYDADDLAFAEDVARRAAIAVENARRFRAIQNVSRQEVDLVADAEQALLVPTPGRAGPVLLSSAAVRAQEGDVRFWDVVPTSTGVHLVVGRVWSGGLDSVRLATVAQRGFRIGLHENGSLGDIARTMDALVRPHLDGLSVEVTLAEVCADGSAQVIRRGDLPTLLVRRGTSTPVERSARPPLGLGADPVQQSLDLSPGDRLVLLCGSADPDTAEPGTDPVDVLADRVAAGRAAAVLVAEFAPEA